MNKVIWWIRRDIRLDDNPALQRALDLADTVIPLVILDEDIKRCACPQRSMAFLLAVKNLQIRLNDVGSALIIRSGDSKSILPSFIQETGASRVIAEEDFSRFSRARDDALKDRTPLELVSGLTIHHPAAVTRTNGKPYTVFTAFKNAWKKLPFSSLSLLKLPLEKLKFEPIRTDSLPLLPETSKFLLTELDAQRQLQDFLLNHSGDYDRLRDYPGEEGTSLLSTCFRFGVLSAKKAVQSALSLLNRPERTSQQGLSTWEGELIWRDFFHAIEYYFPFVQEMAFREKYRAVSWEENDQWYDRWKNGETGYPIVDAGMRQLNASGWMHNRVRMITASFLVKDLFINWQKGERWFMQQLVDGDPAVNNGNWQWIAGCGTDAAPYFRVFNPTLQSQKFDPLGIYIRKWVPELQNVPNTYIHTPWCMPEDLQANLQIRIGKTYPPPIVDHADSRAKFIDRVKVQTGTIGS